ncbi:sulfatase-like hydrolase/transferase, partial [Planctomycetota bacterium]
MEKPNVVVILTDDQGAWANGCYGNSEIHTPNIDKLADTGIRFENFFVATPVCSPSRATFLTGQIPSQHSIHDWLKNCCFGSEAIDFLKDKTAYTDIMAQNGWKCGFSGKWHVGDSNSPQHGFSDWFVAEGGRYSGCRTIQSGQIVEEPGYITDVITDKALEILDSYSKSKDPFYISVHYTAPHSPWIDQHPEKLTSLYDECQFETCPQDYRHPWAKGWINDKHFGNREAL